MLTLYHIVSVLGHIAGPMFFIFGVIGFIVVAYTNNKKINSAVCDTICAICGFGICISIIIGLIVGYCAFPYQSRARETFFKAFWITTCIAWVISLFIVIIISSSTNV